MCSTDINSETLPPALKEILSSISNTDKYAETDTSTEREVVPQDYFYLKSYIS